VRQRKLWVILLFFATVGTAAHAEVGLLLEQPIGRTGHISSAGHVGIYLSRVCAETPTRLRRCRPGESGVVIARYHNADRHDWTAIPLLAYLYAVERPEEIPASIDTKTEALLRDRYRRTRLESVVPDGPDGKPVRRHWVQLVGSAYDREIYVFEMETDPAQDDLLIQELNAKPNEEQFNILFRNCANFAESVLNFYYPHSVHRSFSADFGVATPKQIAKSFDSYARHHTEMRYSVFAIPQVPGDIHRSGKIYGVLEAVVKKKQYVIPLVIWHPIVAAGLGATYLFRGRFNPGRDSITLNRGNEVEALLHGAVPPLNENIQSGRLVNVSAKPNSHKDYKACPASNDCDNQTIAEAGPNTGTR
jgi:hypothetical protein